MRTRRRCGLPARLWVHKHQKVVRAAKTLRDVPSLRFPTRFADRDVLNQFHRQKLA